MITESLRRFERIITPKNIHKKVKVKIKRKTEDRKYIREGQVCKTKHEFHKGRTVTYHSCIKIECCVSLRL